MTITDHFAEPALPDTSAQIPPALYNAKQTAAFVGMSVRWIYRRVFVGEFPAPVKIGTASRWRRSELDAWIEELQ